MKRTLFLGLVIGMAWVSACTDDAPADVEAGNNGTNNGANNGANNGGPVANNGRPDPGHTGNNLAGPECEVPSDCTQGLPLGCEGGSWRCVNNQCRAECDGTPCPYTCNMDCACQVDDDGCDIDACVEDCDELAVALEEVHEADRACVVGEDTCAVQANDACGVTGECYLLVSSAADTEVRRELLLRMARSRCELPVCDCADPPEEAVCVGGQCRLVDDLSCEVAQDCEGLPHDECEGEWECSEAACTWTCAPSCEDTAGEIAQAREALSVCTEGDTCVAASNPLCGSVGDCYFYHVEGADLEAVQTLEARYAGDMCAAVDCDCGDAPEVGCVDDRCQALQ